MSRLLALLACVALAGCSNADMGTTTVSLPGGKSDASGKDLVAASGCLGCHRIGTDGNDGPGPDLTHIGARLSRAQIAHALVKPRAPMPSYRKMSPPDRQVLVDYLAGLR